MIWLVWRLQRASLLLGLAIVSAMAAWLTIARFEYLGRADTAGLNNCLGRGADACQSPGWSTFTFELYNAWGLSRSFLLIIPALVGTAAGAGLFGREFDNGTYMFALTQSVSRFRWWLTGLWVAGVPVVVGVSLLTLITAWAFKPFNGTLPDRGLFAPLFETSGVTPIAYALLAYSIAASAGLIMRNSVGAAATSLLSQLAIEFTLGQFARRSYSSPATAYSALSESYGVIDTASLPKGALRIADGFVDTGGRQISSSFVSCTTVDCLRQAGYTGSYATYQPVERYWPFQVIESSVCVAACIAVLAAGFFTLRRRTG